MISYAKTDTGIVRRSNQDFLFAADQPVGPLPNLFIVADGMGGHKAGDFASRYVVEHMKEYIENVLAPKLQGDGGWVEFVSYENKKLTLIFRGECSKCLILNRCVDWIAQQIKEAKGETVEITAVRKKPFFWDNV